MTRLTVSSARELDFEDLIRTCDELLVQYDVPESMETPDQEFARLSKTIDETPDLYRFFLTLQSYFDHWTDAAADMYGMKSIDYKFMRERRDAMERMASAAKRRYEGASRMITLRENFDPTGMPRTRGGQ
jgi:hypothetical protein